MFRIGYGTKKEENEQKLTTIVWLTNAAEDVDVIITVARGDESACTMAVAQSGHTRSSA